MPILSVERRRSKLDSVFSKVGGIEDPELQSEFSQYLCVLVSRFVEQAVEDILIEHSRVRSGTTVLKYVEDTVGRTNLNMERLLQALGRFDTVWREELDEYTKGERKDALDSVVKLRHNIVHGEGTGITYQRVSAYYANVKEILRRVDELCLS